MGTDSILGKVGDHFEPINNPTTSRSTTFNSHRQHTTKATLQIPLRRLMGRMVLQTRVRNPANMLVRLKPLRQSESVASMSLSAQTQRLQTQQKLLRRKWVQRRAQIAQDLDSHPDRERYRPERLPELQSVVPLGWLDELGES